MVALSFAHFVSGFRVDLVGIGALLRTRDVLFAVDAIQTLGASSHRQDADVTAISSTAPTGCA
ncbi:MAG TPA: hypothetical protein VIL70_09230 [Chthoniobacterales bacterium]